MTWLFIALGVAIAGIVTLVIFTALRVASREDDLWEQNPKDLDEYYYPGKEKTDAQG